jgi:5'-3' exonuclease
MGDKSDNISQVFLRCGPKTALSLVKNKDELNRRLVESADATEKYNLNKKIIAFSETPIELTEKIKKAINEALYSEDIINPTSDLKSFMMGF